MTLPSPTCSTHRHATWPSYQPANRERAPVLVPFIGADHDWSAVELGAWLASVRDGKLTLVGPTDDERDSSRLLASASIAVQRALGVTVVPVVIPPGADELVEVANEAAIVVVGLSDRWRTEGLGPVRSALAARAVPPVILVHEGFGPAASHRPTACRDSRGRSGSRASSTGSTGGLCLTWWR